jgi:N-dimethylarginine dimethylaminohydrolase
VLRATPDYFEVAYEINVHMVGNIGLVDNAAAKEQWERVRAVYESLQIPVEVIHSSQGLPDQVFAANDGVILKRDGRVLVIPSRMASEKRIPEIPPFIAWAKSKGHTVMELPDQPDMIMEGMGDLLWHPGRAFMYAGYGHRTTRAAVEKVQEMLDVPLVILELVDPRWYHLDTALAPINEDTALIVPMAFTPEGRKMIHACYKNVIEVSEEEGVNFVANGFSPDGKHFIMHRGSDAAKKQLEAIGLQVIEVDTSEYLKAGGSVFCMKLHVFA